MRNPDRIDIVLEEVRKYWKTQPDMRLGQLIINAARFGGFKHDVFQVEEEVILKGLGELNKNLKE